MIAKKECVLLCLRAKYERIYKAEPVNVNKTVCLGSADLSRQERERNAKKPRREGERLSEYACWQSQLQSRP